MQAINFNQTLLQGLNRSTDFYVFYFTGIIPSSLDEISFDYLSLKEVTQNSVDYSICDTNQVQRNILSLGFTPFTDSPMDTEAESTSYYPVDPAFASADYWTSEKQIERWGHIDTSYNLTKLTNDSTYTRIGREQASLYINLRESDVNTNIVGFTFRQRNISSRQKQPSWTSSSARSTRCTSVAFDYLDEELNDWVVGESFDTDALEFEPKIFEQALSGYKYYRVRCLTGPVQAGYVVSSGDPHWSVSSFCLLTDQPISKPAVTWALVYSASSLTPLDGQYTLEELDTIPYANIFIKAPIFAVDVGSPGSGAAIELINNPVPEGQYSQIYKFNIKIRN